MIIQNDRLVEELEARQLEEELKLVREFEVEKKAIMTRLKHMEAYCQTPTPPPTPVGPENRGPSSDEQLPERRVTDRDYHNLAQQYRERGAMDSLHVAKINVLRGRQKKAVENFILNRERHVEVLERQQEKEIAGLDNEATKEEEALKTVFADRRARLELRWRLQAAVQCAKMEKLTGSKFAPLAEVQVTEDMTVNEHDRLRLCTGS